MKAASIKTIGTPQQRAQADILIQTADQHAYAECMRRAGFDYPRPNVDRVTVQPKIYEPFWWALPSRADAALGFGCATAPVNESPTPEQSSSDPYDSLTPARKAAYDAALDACVQAADADSGTAKAQNAAGLALQQSLRDTLEAPTKTVAFSSIKKRYGSCMSNEGVPVDDPGSLYDIAESAVLVKGGLGNLDPRSAEYAAQQPKALAKEVSIANSDVTCRAPLADQIVSILAPVFDQWMTANAATLRNVSAGWTRIGR